MKRVRRALGMAALLLVALSYLPGVYGFDSSHGYEPGRRQVATQIHPATVVVMVCTGLIGFAIVLNSLREPLWNGYDRTKLRGLTLVSVAVPVIGFAVYMGLAIWSSTHISHWDNVYCRIDLHPTHYKTCAASETHFENGFRDIFRAGMWAIVGYAAAREAERPPSDVPAS